MPTFLSQFQFTLIKRSDRNAQKTDFSFSNEHWFTSHSVTHKYTYVLIIGAFNYVRFSGYVTWNVGMVTK